jgi:concanavalin A-like lectin/glucanase superfamily protein
MTSNREPASSHAIARAATILLFTIVLCTTMLAAADSAPEPGLLFHLSADNGFTADYAGGEAEPNFLEGVRVIPDGKRGPGFRAGMAEVVSYWAPGNIYAERGTLSFFWRSGEPMGKTPFPIFRVGYADHSSWDMVWLRIDYNGDGFDAFVTDINLARIRVSHAMSPLPGPDDWTHFVLSWDETYGIRFYVNGTLAVEEKQPAVLYAGLDQFGPHARTIGPMQVQSAYIFQRGGDIDEIRIYDRMLSDDNVATLAKGDAPSALPELKRDLADSKWRDEWWLRYGWNRGGDPPPYTETPQLSVRKVEIHDVYDLKRWWWKGNDGIRETTWPGVYNWSRLPGRNDYFQLPDWDCYSLSGKSVTFMMPDEPWNHLEIAGGAWGKISLLAHDREKGASTEAEIFDRPKGQERTYHRLQEAVQGEKIRFDNVEQETPIGEFSAFYVSNKKEPVGIAGLTYRITAKVEPDNFSLAPLVKFINGRHAADERSIAVALPRGAPRTPRKESAPASLPIVHILIPADFRDGTPARDRNSYSYTWENMNAGLDGIAIDLPALAVKPTHGEYFPLNIQVKDPLWPMRNLLDFTFSVKPGEAKTLWLDTRDRILPDRKSLYLTIAGAGADFDASDLEGAEIRLIFKPRTDAAPEHELDRFTQVRDNYAMLVEEHTNTRRLNLYARFEADAVDLLRVNPDHYPGRNYWADANREQAKPPFAQPVPPAGTPLWAFRQVENLRYLKQFVTWYIDNRQIENGELGGGLSDDGDLTNWWPGTALMGAAPEKITESLLRLLEAFYDQGLFTNGLSTIQTDELHAYEEGIQVVSQSLMLDYGSPKQLERAMETTRALEAVTGINSAGHRHFRSSFYGGTKISQESVWEWTSSRSYLVLHPALMLVYYNGNPATKKWIIELADGLLAHRKRGPDGKYRTRTAINFRTDEDRNSSMERSGSLLWAAYRWTGDRKYAEALLDTGVRGIGYMGGNAIDLLGLRESGGELLAGLSSPRTSRGSARHFAWQLTGDKGLLEDLYADQIEASALREYINTDGSLWIDRVSVDHTELQRARLGGIAVVRNVTYPGHAVSWKFERPASDQSVAILVPDATLSAMTIIAHNLDPIPVDALMTAWDIEPGEWKVEQGIDVDGDDSADKDLSSRTVTLERGGGFQLTFAPQATTILKLALQSKGTDYWARPDLGIGKDDVVKSAGSVRVKIHSLGSEDAPAATIALRDAGGTVLATASVSALKAPLDLLPKTAEVSLTAPSGVNLDGGSVCIDPDRKLEEITTRNNCVALEASR